MSEISKRVVTCLSNGNYVLSSIEKFWAKIALALANTLGGMNPQEVEKMLQALKDYLTEQNQNLETFELAYAKERADDPEHLQDRDKAMRALIVHLREIKKFIRKHAPTKQRSFGLNSAIPQSGIKLQQYTQHVWQLLSEDSAPINGLFGMKIVPSLAAEELEPLLQNLTSTLENVQTEARKLDEARIARDQALDDWKVAYQSVSNIFAGFYLVAGEPKLAQRIRPTTRKTSGDARIEEPAPEDNAASESSE